MWFLFWFVQLTQAQESVSSELQRLDNAMEKCLNAVDTEFAEMISKVEKRRADLQAAIASAASDKKRVLEEQHALIQAEKNKVEQECEGLQYQVRLFYRTFLNYVIFLCSIKTTK